MYEMLAMYLGSAQTNDSMEYKALALYKMPLVYEIP